MAKKTVKKPAVKKAMSMPKKVKKPTSKEQITALETKVAKLTAKVSALKTQLAKRDRQLKRAKK